MLGFQFEEQGSRCTEESWESGFSYQRSIKRICVPSMIILPVSHTSSFLMFTHSDLYQAHLGQC